MTDAELRVFIGCVTVPLHSDLHRVDLGEAKHRPDLWPGTAAERAALTAEVEAEAAHLTAYAERVRAWLAKAQL